MNITLKRTGLMLVLASALASSTLVFAQSRFQDGAYGYVAQNDDRFRSNNQDRRGDDGRRQSNDRNNGRNENRNAERSDQGRRDRMSPDERRALRRQIDEAGRDIYAPRR